MKTFLFLLISLVVFGCTQTQSMQPYTVYASVKVCIVGSKMQLPEKVKATWPTALGCAYRDGTIWIVGSMNRFGEIEIDEGLLGHELLHVLHWNSNGRIIDPDAR